MYTDDTVVGYFYNLTSAPTVSRCLPHTTAGHSLAEGGILPHIQTHWTRWGQAPLMQRYPPAAASPARVLAVDSKLLRPWNRVRAVARSPLLR